MSKELNDKLNSEELTLEEKLALIQEITDKTTVDNQRRVDLGVAPKDPMDDLMCEGCQ